MTLDTAQPWRVPVQNHLDSGQWADAVKLLFAHLQSAPGDGEALLLLGDCYLAAGAGACARVCYARLQPRGVRTVETRLRLAADLSAVKPDRWVTASQVPDTPAAVRACLDERAQTSESVEESEVSRLRPTSGDVGRRLEESEVSRLRPEEAESFIESILATPNPVGAVQDRLAEVVTWLPGLLDLAAEQAKAEGEPRRAQALGRLSQTVRERLNVDLSRTLT